MHRKLLLPVVTDKSSTTACNPTIYTSIAIDMEMIVTNTLTLIFLFLAIECAGKMLPNSHCNTLKSFIHCIATSHQQATSTTVRLTGFNSTVFGRVEIHSNGTWSVPCSDKWTLKNSFVACKTLRYNHAIMINNDHLR